MCSLSSSRENLYTIYNYVHEDIEGEDSNSTHNPETEEDRSPLNWKNSNPDWYPANVIDGRSAGLKKFIDDFLKGTRETLENNESTYWNNLTASQRSAISSLAEDTSIVIKPSDKCGSIVIMNTEDYEKACLDTLTNNEHYEEIPVDLNPSYKEEVQEVADELLNNNLINELEHSNLIKGSRTPVFYGLPKMHNPFTNFPSLRPISSGTDSCTARLSEFVDSFLKAAASKIPSSNVLSF